MTQLAPPDGRPKVATIAPPPVSAKRLRVAGYCRISTFMESQDTSIASQRAHYRHVIESNPRWELVDIYWERGVSGTKASSRPELQRLIADCEAGHIDMVLTKSISRFSRNTADCLAMIRTLTSLGVVLRFDKENIQTDRMESEFLLTILTALAQEEVRSISHNMKWGIRKRFEAGTYRPARLPYGYGRRGQALVLRPAEANVVRRIFYALIEGRGADSIAAELNAQRVPTWTKTHGGPKGLWRTSTIRDLVGNPFYTGDTLYQRTYRDDEYRQRKNRGACKRQLHEASHPAIVDHDTYVKANYMSWRHATEGRSSNGAPSASARRANRYPFSGKLVCGACGATMYRGGADRAVYLCHNHHVHASCAMPPAYEEAIQNAFATVLNKLFFGETTFGFLSAYADGVRQAETKEIEAEKGAIASRLAEAEREREALLCRMLAEPSGVELQQRKLALEAKMRVLQERRAQLVARAVQADEATRLRKQVEARGILRAFCDEDGQLFAAHVRRAVVWSRERVEFQFACGLALGESLAFAS